MRGYRQGYLQGMQDAVHSANQSVNQNSNSNQSNTGNGNRQNSANQRGGQGNENLMPPTDMGAEGPSGSAEMQTSDEQNDSEADAASEED